MNLSVSYPEHSELGKKSAYDAYYNPDKLFAIPRKKNREALGLTSGQLPFYGFDVWNHYEVSWLNAKGKPIVAIAEIIYGCDSVNIFESKSMKLYFNSFNNTQFNDIEILQTTIKFDLEKRVGGSSLHVKIIPLSQFNAAKLLPKLEGNYLDELDIDCSIYSTHPDFLTTENEIVQEILYSDLLKSNCLVTNQPDWCSVQITYTGKKINREGLLRYLVSFRNDNEFHEQCIEKIFLQMMQRCAPTELTVYGRSTRRGGLDINSIRSTKPIHINDIPNIRLCRQ
jgi:7-cyano-7-deazaguanine reductase